MPLLAPLDNPDSRLNFGPAIYDHFFASHFTSLFCRSVTVCSRASPAAAQAVVRMEQTLLRIATNNHFYHYRNQTHLPTLQHRPTPQLIPFSPDCQPKHTLPSTTCPPSHTYPSQDKSSLDSDHGQANKRSKRPERMPAVQTRP
jgi:hypothetical protein